MQRFLLMRFLWACLLLVGITNTAFADPNVEQFDSRGKCPANNFLNTYTLVKKETYPGSFLASSVEVWGCNSTNVSTGVVSYNGNTGFLTTCVMSAMVKDNSCKCDQSTGAFYQSAPSPTGSCGCPAGKEMNLWNKQCVAPCPVGQERQDPDGHCAAPAPICNSPKIEENGACVCPAGTVVSGETCISPPDCTGKQAECLSSCATQGKPLSRFYCESSTAADPSTQLFSGESYHCACGSAEGCPTGQQQVISVTGSTSCAPNAADPNGCPVGSYYGDFNGQTGCIQPSQHDDPDESPNNCMTGTNAVYYGSTMYCVPPPDTTNCPTGTTSFVTDTGLKICKGTDTGGNPTGDSPDTNGSIRGTPTSGSGTGTGDGDNSGTDISAGEEQIADKLDASKAQLDAIKADTGAIKQSSSLTAANTAAIKDAVTGSASTTAQGSFAESTAAIQAEVETLKTEYGATLADVKGQMTTFLSDLNTPTGTGGLPCYPSITIPVLNIPFALCFTQFEEALSIIGTYIYGIAFLFAGLIILGSTRGEG